jgi:hypothetical protein
MKKPGTIVGSRLHWEGPYLFLGWKNARSKRQAVIQDATGRKWFRVSSQLRKYYPRLDFARVYLQAIKEVDDRVPSMAEILQRFCELPASAPSFVTLNLDCRENCENKTNGGLPTAGKDSPFSLTSRAFFTNRWQNWRIFLTMLWTESST